MEGLSKKVVLECWAESTSAESGESVLGREESMWTKFLKALRAPWTPSCTFVTPRCWATQGRYKYISWWLIWQWIEHRAEYTQIFYLLFFLLPLLLRFLGPAPFQLFKNCVSPAAWLFTMFPESLKCRLIILEPKDVSVSPQCAFVFCTVLSACSKY